MVTPIQGNICFPTMFFLQKHNTLLQDLKEYMVEESKDYGNSSLLLSVVLPPFPELAVQGFDLNIIARF